MKTLVNTISNKFETVKDYITIQNIFIVLSGLALAGLTAYIAFVSDYATYIQ